MTEVRGLEDNGAQDAPIEALWKNPGSARKVVHALLNGKHIDPLLSEEFRFLEDYVPAWEEFFRWLGYRLKRSELGGSPFFFLDPVTDLASQPRLSRGATFLGLYLAWQFFMQGPGGFDHISASELFSQIVSSYPYQFLRPIFMKKSGGAAQIELSEDQAEKLRGCVKKELTDLARYRFIDLKPSVRSQWEDLVVYRLPALYRFWDLARHVLGSSGGSEQDVNLNDVVCKVWGSVETEPEEEEQ